MNAQGYQLSTLFRADAEDCPRPDRAQLLTQAAGEIEKQITEIKALRDAIGGLLRYCVTVDGMPNKYKGRTAEQQAAYDAARTALKGATK